MLLHSLSKLWYLFLRKYPVKIYKQRIIDKFVVDFYCASAKLVIEIDGSQHYESDGLRKDRIRTEHLEERKLTVIRIPNNEVMQDFRGVCEYIDHYVQNVISR